ncbi:hypothetical protein LCGC14_0892900 [marine sediment metagenome]|uniref:Uncharacterized protein n=1 Tax=marine sediment metagenome TaxID=412755 RepID=A0A0F9PJE3_9ZZZZ
MLETTIPKSIRQIIDEFIWSNFRPFTYKMLADRLRYESNTIVQRINRNPKYFKTVGDKPKIIELNKDLEEIYFYRDKNTCQICQKQKEPTELLIRLKDPYLKDDYNWENVITCCQDCKDINIIKKLSYKQKDEHIGTGNYIWEYKEIQIREVHKKKNPYFKLYFPDFKETEIEYVHYYEFNESSGQVWHHIIDENNEICENLSDILNYFGIQGWELMIIKPDTPDDPVEGWGMDHYIFKRKKKMEEI